MDKIGQIFVRGFLTVLPLALTVYILAGILRFLEGSFARVLQNILPNLNYIPGLGLLLLLILIFIVGLLVNNFVINRFLNSIEKKMLEIPFIKTIYSPLKDLMNLFSKKDNQKSQNVALVKVGDKHLLGIITREQFVDLNFSMSTVNKVAVYFPLSYGLGGYTMLVDKSDITEVNLPIEKAMSLAITGWVKADEKDSGESKNELTKK
jgi:uncharacterized membrane protein